MTTARHFAAMFAIDESATRGGRARTARAVHEHRVRQQSMVLRMTRHSSSIPPLRRTS